MPRKTENRTKRNKDRSYPRKGIASRSRKLTWIGLSVAVAVIVLLAVNGPVWGERSADASPIEFTDVEVQTEEFLGYYESIQLDPQQELVKKEALSGIPAPCCSDNSAYTCCCPCNMAKSWWGLSHHLIVNEGYGADEVQAAVEGWIDFINPDGFSGDACYTGGCGRPFNRNGCGGMDENHVVYE